MLILLGLAFLLSFSSPGDAVSSLIVPPIRPSGEEAAVIFIPGANIKGEAYLKTAAAIQNASPLRLWVALTGNYSLETPNPVELPKAVENAIKQLSKAGMKGDNYTGIAHSLGGVFLSTYAKKSQLKAVVLLGSYLSRETSFKDYPLPVLTLSGELDGQARITRIAVEYKKLQDIIKSPDAVFRYPVINIPKINHAQFASGVMPPAVTKYDLTPEVTEDVAHVLIGKQVSNFLTVTFDGPSAMDVLEAKEAIVDSFVDSGKRFEPLLFVNSMDEVPILLTSPWSVLCQEVMAGQLAPKIKVDNLVAPTETIFVVSFPSIARNSTDLVVKTKSFIQYDSNPLDISTTPESPQEVDVKCKSYEAIQSALNVSASLTAANTTCRDLNELALNIAYLNSRSEAQQRYKSKGRPLTFQDDVTYKSGFEWAENPLKLVEDDSGLHVQSVALRVSLHSPVFPGDFYCKVISPYRAMEWINVDSLRAHKP
uniref:Alpha/beta hydrolase fold-5 domain-containing protein n=1 Tax=Biomphalaria glabrata TaxID=6526 RepID=A0A2C9L2H0_BIOGL